MRNFIRLTSWLLFIGLLTIRCGHSDEGLTPAKSSAKELSDLAVNGTRVRVTTYVDATSTYYLLIPAGTDLHAINLSFSLPPEASATPVSGTIQDFTKPVIYAVTAADGSAKTFTVNMTF